MEQLISLLPLDAPLEHNGVTYPTHALQAACNEFEQRIKQYGPIPGECRSPILDPEAGITRSAHYS